MAVYTVHEPPLRRYETTTDPDRFVFVRDGFSFWAFLFALLIGFEAGTLRRFTLARRRWSNVGVIVGDDREMAEQRFFDSWIRGGANGPWPPPLSPPARTDSASGVNGLFPQPGVPR